MNPIISISYINYKEVITMASIKLYGTSLVKYIYGDQYSQEKAIIEPVYDMLWRLSGGSRAFVRNEGFSGRGEVKQTTNVREILPCTAHGVSSLLVDDMFTTYMDTDTIQAITYNSPATIKRGILDTHERDNRNISKFVNHMNEWVRLTAYIFPFIKYIGKQKGRTYIVQLSIPTKVFETVLPIIQRAISDVFKSYSKSSVHYENKVPTPTIDDSHDNIVIVTYMSTGKVVDVFEKWIQFTQTIYNRGGVGFNNNAVPTEILTGSDSVQKLFIDCLTEVTSLKTFSENECGLFYDSRRSMVISLKWLFDQQQRYYKLSETITDGVYRGTIYTQNPNENTATYSPFDAYIGKGTTRNPITERDLFDITFDDNEIWVDGLIIPFHE